MYMHVYGCTHNSNYMYMYSLAFPVSINTSYMYMIIVYFGALESGGRVYHFSSCG